MLELVRESTASRAPVHPTSVHVDDHAWGLDEPLQAIWGAIRHLFPAHAMVNQVDHGCLLVSWSLRARRRGTHFAAPIIIRVDSGLLLALWTCDAEEREQIADIQVETVSDALAGYDPHSRVPTCGVIVLGA